MPLIDVGSLRPTPWKNGGGNTRTLAVSPDDAGFDDFDWRISIADVRVSGDFSLFPGVDRTILLLDGRGMMLHNSDGSIHALTAPFRPWRMRGDDPVRASLLNGSARDFNVMVRRGRVDASVQVWQSETSLPNLRGDAVFYCPRGSFAISVTNGEDVVIAADSAFRVSAGAEVRIAPAAPNAILIGVLTEPTDSSLTEERNNQ